MNSLWSGLIVLVTIGAVTAAANSAVYGRPPASVLEGSVLLVALVGGTALAFSRPFLLVAIPYLSVLLGGRTAGWPSALYPTVFALTFVIAISGVPAALATPIHRSEWLVDPIGSLVLVAAGLYALAGGSPSAPVRRHESGWRRADRWLVPGLLGAAVGALMYHELDPAYDSVFFATGNAVAASHAPVTVALFTAGLGLAYVASGSALRGLLGCQPWADAAVRALAGVATALLGVAILIGGFRIVRGLLL